MTERYQWETDSITLTVEQGRMRMPIALATRIGASLALA